MKEQIKEEKKWIWMPHAGHCIIGDQCIFHLNTYVGKYIVSTIGEYNPDESSKRIHASIHKPEWYKQNENLKGDYFKRAYFKEFGFEEIGFNRKYETMVFKAKRGSKNIPCCKFIMANPSSLDLEGYNNAKDAVKGHMKMCKKWSKK